jgi:hypothetical protein
LLLGRFISDYFIKWLTNDREPVGFPLCDFGRICYEIKPCDVLLIEGRSRISDAIRAITQSSWSHAVLYIGRLHDIADHSIRDVIQGKFTYELDTQLIIESVLGKGTIISPISSYKKDHIRICRPRGLSPQDAQKVISYASNKIGNTYDIRQIFDLGRFLLPWSIIPKRFSSKLFAHDASESTKDVCSSMIAEAFSSIDFPILPFIQETENGNNSIELITRNPMLYTPRDFDYSPYFEIIKYPFVEFGNYTMYRNLPWNKSGVQSDDNQQLFNPAARLKTKKKKQHLDEHGENLEND